MRRVKVDGRAARRLREAAGLSQESLAQLADVSLGTVRNIETGRTETPDKLTLQAVAAALGVDPEKITASDDDAESVPA